MLFDGNIDRQFTCYLCNGREFDHRPGSVRDNHDLKVYECRGCGLVSLSSFEHAAGDFYEDSGMHGEQPLDIAKWLADTAADDERRFLSLEANLSGKKLLDFGCGTGGFLLRARKATREAHGVELEKRLQSHFLKNNLTVFENIEDLRGKQSNARYDLITLFHVLEHLPDPKGVLIGLADLLSEQGEIVVEVPHADDALLTLYECEPFSHFTYWSCHLFLFTVSTLEMLINQAGLKLNYIKQIQRYPLGNHLYWLAKGKPGGHKVWSFLDSPALRAAYEKQLAGIGKCDTLVMSVSA